MFQVLKLRVENGVLYDRESQVDGWESWFENREWNDGNYGSRVEARIVETRDDEPREMGLLFIVTSPIV